MLCGLAIRTPAQAQVPRPKAISMAAFNDAVALEDYTEAIRLSPQHAGSYYGRGLAYQELGNTAEAKKDIDRARQLDPKIGMK